MKVIKLIAVAFMFTIVSHAQTYQKSFEANFGANDYSFGPNVNDDVEVIKTSDNSYLIVGAKVLKTDLDGNVLWGKTFSGQFLDVIEDAGSYIATGILLNNVYVAKFDALGNSVWSKTYALPASLSNSSNRGYVIKKSLTGYVIGGYGDFYGRALLMEIDQNGNLNWVNSYVNNQTRTIINDLEILSNNDIIVTGSTAGPIGATNFYDTYLMRVNSTGAIIWEKSFVTSTASMAFSISKGPGNTYFCAGGININENGTDESALFVFDDNGNLLHANKYLTPNDGLFYDVAYNSSNNTVYAVGEVNMSKRQTFMVSTDVNANLIDAKLYGRTQKEDKALDILIDNSNILIAGLSFDQSTNPNLEYSLIKTDLNGDAIRCLQFDITPTVSPVTFTETSINSTITDVTGTTTVTSITENNVYTTFTLIDRLLTVQIDVLKEDCNNSGIAEIKMTASGGNKYNFYNTKLDGINQLQANPLTISNVSGGFHSIIVDDYQECAYIDTIFINSNPAPFSTVLDSIHKSCDASNTGAIFTTLMNGGAYTYQQWSTGSQNDDLTQLAPGNYSVKTADFLTKCFTQDTFAVGSFEPITVTIDNFINPTSCTSNDGVISIIGFAGIDSAIYSIDGGTSYQASGYYANLSPGNYNVVVKSHQSQCVVSGGSVNLSAPPLVTPPLTLYKDTVCQNEIGVIYEAAFEAGKTYFWSVPANASIVAGSNTNQITVDFTNFSGGFITLSTQDNAGCSSDTLSLLVSTPTSQYSIPKIDILCETSVFNIPINSGVMNQEVVGVDFCFKYDTLVMTPTGTATLSDAVHGGTPAYADYYLNTTQKGQITGIIYITGAAPFPTFINGTGTLIDINFALNSGVAAGTIGEVELCGISEGTLYSGTIDLCSGFTSQVEVLADKETSANIAFWGKSAKPLKYDTLNPATYLITEIMGYDENCVASGSTTFVPDLDGNFTYNIDEGIQYKVSRDIAGNFGTLVNCTNVMSSINGADQLKAAQIATYDISIVPTVHQIIAADVNKDGKVTSVDVSLISSRSVMSICGYPNNGAGNSIDWVFVNQSVLSTDPSFTISTAFPSGDGSGYWAQAVPVVPECLSVAIDTAPICVSIIDDDIDAILLGDINGNWKSSDGSTFLMKSTTNVNSLFIDLANSVFENNQHFIPVHYTNNSTVEAIDFNFEFDVNKTSAISTKKMEGFLYSGLEINYNTFKNIFLMSSYSLEELAVNGNPLQLVISSQEKSLRKEDFISPLAYINGEEVKVIFENIASSLGSEIENTLINVYPNPANNFVKINIGQNISANLSYQLFDISGKLIASNKIANNETIIRMENLVSAIYFIKILENNKEIKTFKIVKN